jgi:hypothetical protein
VVLGDLEGAYTRYESSYRTEAEALEGHARAAAGLRATLESKPAVREPVAIGALMFHAGPALCERCTNHDGGHHRGWCESCAPHGHVIGMMCTGLCGESCVAGRVRLEDGCFELPNGERGCRDCAAVACGYRGLDDAIDLGILTAIEVQERA